MNPVATMLNNIIKTATGAALQIKTDNIAEGSDYYFESEYEILIGYTDRKEAREFYNSFKKDDSGYALVGKKLLILGYTGEGANKSALLFKTDLLDKKSNSDVLLNAGESKIVSSKYEYQTILLNGTDISKYKIVYPKVSSKGEKEIATYLQEWIAYHTGYILNCVNDSAQAGEYEIQIGTTSRITSEMLSARDADGFNDEKTYIGINGKTVWLSGNSRMALYTAFTKLTNFAVFSDTNISIDINSSDSYPINQLKVSVMNYNIYYDLNEKKRNPDDVIVSIKQKNADVFGLLEAGADWIAKINPEVSATYTCVSTEVFDKLVSTVNGYKEYFMSHNQPIYENPSPGNKAGGITTLEEKSLGCITKGGTSPVVDVLTYGDTVNKQGLNLLDGPGNDIVACTNLCAVGCQIILFTTGRGTPLGAPVPTVKIATNTELYNKKEGWLDFNAGELLDGKDLDEKFFDKVLAVASGELTANEKNGYREISIFKDGVML